MMHRRRAGADFGRDDKILRIGMKSLADELIGYARTIVIAGVDVVDAARDRLAQHRDRAVVVLRRPEDARSRELHGAVAKALHEPIAKRKRSGVAEVRHGFISSWNPILDGAARADRRMELKNDPSGGFWRVGPSRIRARRVVDVSFQ
jgi:hypothetical protein